MDGGSPDVPGSSGRAELSWPGPVAASAGCRAAIVLTGEVDRGEESEARR